MTNLAPGDIATSWLPPSLPGEGTLPPHGSSFAFTNFHSPVVPLTTKTSIFASPHMPSMMYGATETASPLVMVSVKRTWYTESLPSLVHLLAAGQATALYEMMRCGL